MVDDDVDALDAALFGNRTSAMRSSSAKSATGRVSFLDDVGGGRAQSSLSSQQNPQRPASKSILDDLFGSDKGAASTSTAARPASKPAPSNLDSIFGPSGSSSAAKSANPEPQISTQQADPNVARIQRLEKEVDSLNRELDEAARKRKDDLDDCTADWKKRLAERETAHSEQLQELRDKHSRRVAELQAEHSVEISNLKESYQRQLETMKESLGTVSTSADLTSVAEKVDRVAAQLEATQNLATRESQRALDQREAAVAARERQLETRETALTVELDRLSTDRKEVMDLQSRLKSLCDQREGDIDQERWRLKDERTRLAAERKSFKDDQSFILERVESQRAQLEQERARFVAEQRDLILRVAAEHERLEQAKTEFEVKRNSDARRIRQEMETLQDQIDEVRRAERAVEELRRGFDTKNRQVIELENALLEECEELERARRKILAAGKEVVKGPLTSPSKAATALPSERRESVRAALRAHTQLLDRYVGQKVAAVAPRSLATFDRGRNSASSSNSSSPVGRSLSSRRN